MLTNPVYLGWWCYDNTILVDETGKPKITHDPIIPLARQDELFWHIFRQRSPYNIDGTKNLDSIGQRPRRYTQLDSPPNPAMLKKVVRAADPTLIIRVQPQYSAENFRTGKYLYAFRLRMNGYSGSAKYMLATELVDNVYWQALMSHLWQTEDFASYANTEEQQEDTREKDIKETRALIDACERKLAKLFKRLTLVQEGQEDEEDEIVLDEEEQIARDKALKKMLKFLTDEITKYTVEKQRLEARLKKLEDSPDTYCAQMIEYHDLLRQLGDRVREIYSIEELYDVVTTFTTGVTLDTISPRVWKLVITWRDPAWGQDEIVSLRLEGNPGNKWTPVEKELLRMQYGISTRRELLEMLPTRSWIGIRTIASEMGLRRSRDDTPNEFPYDICLADWQAVQVHGLVIAVDKNNLLVRLQQEETTTNSPNAVNGNCVQSWR